MSAAAIADFNDRISFCVAAIGNLLMSFLRCLFSAIALLCSALLVGCQPASSGPPKSTSPPAKVAQPVTEAKLNTIELRSEAVQRLAIETAVVEARQMRRSRPYGAELVLPTAASVIISAPLSGTIQLPGDRPMPQIGAKVAADEPVLHLVPILSPDRSVLTPSERVRLAESKNTLAQSRIDAEGLVEQAKVQVDAANIALDRAKRLLREQAGTARAVDDATAQLQLAQKTLENAENRRRLLGTINLDEDAGTFEPLSITSPLSGIVRSTLVGVGQTVVSGAPLFEVLNDDLLWVKVPVYVGDLDEIDTTTPARLIALNGRWEDAGIAVAPAELPPTAVTAASAIDLYYDLPNELHAYRVGQRLTAQLPLKGEAEHRILPWSAVYHDIYGNQWVYEQLQEGTYLRRRVEVLWIDGKLAVIGDGPSIGTAVVTAGVAELAGTEFGFAK